MKVEAGEVSAHCRPCEPLPQPRLESNKPPPAKQPSAPADSHLSAPASSQQWEGVWTTCPARAGMPTLHSLPWLKVASMDVRLPFDHDDWDPVIFIRTLKSPYL